MKFNKGDVITWTHPRDNVLYICKITDITETSYFYEKLNSTKPYTSGGSRIAIEAIAKLYNPTKLEKALF